VIERSEQVGSLWTGVEGQRRTAAAANVYWPERRRTGQRENAKDKKRGCTAESKGMCLGLWRKHGCGGGRPAWRKANELMHARCSM
jgi:hypothetical protein